MRSYFPIPQRCLIVGLIVSLGLGACKRIEKDTPSTVLEAIEKVREDYCPDRRLCVFDVAVLVRGANLKLSGELTNPRVKDIVVQAVKAAMPDFKVEEEIQLLPDPALGDRLHGLVRLSVANMRKKPAHTAELVNQVLMGRIVSLLKAKNNWCYVQSDDGYLGWMTTGSLRLCNKQECEEWGAADRIAYIQLNGVIYSEMSETAMPISDVVLGNIMRRLETIRTGSARVWQEWVKVALPDGRQGFLPKSTVAELGEIFPKTPTLAQRLVATAQRCLGIPFLWGGNSAHGFDAAGFVQTVFSLNGVQLLRDADQQARDGKPVEIGSRFNELRPADLLFFGSRADQIDHVGISLGGPRFFHTRDFVQISSLDPNDADYNSELRDRFQFVRRHFEEIASISSHGKL